YCEEFTNFLSRTLALLLKRTFVERKRAISYFRRIWRFYPQSAHRRLCFTSKYGQSFHRPNSFSTYYHSFRHFVPYSCMPTYYAISDCGIFDLST
uniref:ABC transporter domain-containing protein n=1 Tax=Parascaris univalens TaxID=6257 RepID=A0A915AJF5_PARUN